MPRVCPGFYSAFGCQARRYLESCGLNRSAFTDRWHPNDELLVGLAVTDVYCLMAPDQAFINHRHNGMLYTSTPHKTCVDKQSRCI